MASVTTWRAVPISTNKMLDVNPNDLISGGHFRLCQTYKGGGGCDQFPRIPAARGLVSTPSGANRQLVVQLWGCNLDCPYCYVTRAGVWGEPTVYTTQELSQAWRLAQTTHGVNVFHLMGGAPALYLRQWPKLLDAPPPQTLFHSDLMLSEGSYDDEVLVDIDRPGVLLAVNVKGTDSESWERNTRKPYHPKQVIANLDKVRRRLSPERWYITFTNVAPDAQEAFISEYGLEEQTEPLRRLRKSTTYPNPPSPQSTNGYGTSPPRPLTK